MTTTSEINFYVDTLLVESALAEPHLYKKAGFITDALSRIKEYLASKIDKEHPIPSVLNLLAPTAITMLFRSLGFGGFGLLLGLLTTVFHVNVAGMISSLYEKVKEMISGGEKVHPSQIDQAVNSTIEEQSSPPSPSEMEEGYQALQKQQGQAPADDGKVYSSLELLHDAKMISLALIEYEKQNMRLTKTADFSSFTKSFGPTRAKGTSLLGRILGWIFKFALTAAGLLIVGAIADHFLGGGESHPTSSGPVASQTKYHLIGDSPLPREMPITNTPDNIDNMIVQFAKDVYSGLDGKEGLIKNSPAFKVIKQKISWTNMYNPGSSSVMIPPIFTSKKQLVDYFIDDVAKSDQA